MILLLVRFLIFSFETLLGITVQWWNLKRVREHYRQSFHVWRSWLLPIVYSDLIIIGLLYVYFPEVIIFILNFIKPLVKDIEDVLMVSRAYLSARSVEGKKPNSRGRKVMRRKKSSNKSFLIRKQNRYFVFKMTKILVWFLSLPSAPFHVLAKRISNLILDNGTDWTVIYLKECHRILMAHVAGNHIRHTDVLVGIRTGIPTLIPTALWPYIRSQDETVIRGILSVLQCYRVIEATSKLNLGTIVRPFSGHSTTLPQVKLEEVMKEFPGVKGKELGSLAWLPENSDSITPILSAGPNHKTSFKGLDFEAWLFNNEEEFLPLRDSLVHFLDNPGLIDLFYVSSEYYDRMVQAGVNEYPLLEKFRLRPKLGKLSTKLEPAGKVRVFAIVDGWTQAALKPLHKKIFSILRLMDQDGTFDQSGALTRLLNRIGPDRETFSFDLSAATDRLPIDLQVQVLSYLIGEDSAIHWKNLLVGRDYQLSLKLLKRQRIEIPEEFKDNIVDGDWLSLRYSVGQPMGALSSWAMLAITHHIIVQYASRMVGNKGWFSDYAVLGDDIVIANKAVAWAYHSIMTDILGVEINLSKSLQSTTSVVEYAKRLASPEKEFTPIGANLVFQISKSRKITERDYHLLFVDSINKGMTWSSVMIRSLFLDSDKESKKWFERNMWRLLGPFGVAPMESSPTPRLKVTGSFEYSDLVSLFNDLSLSIAKHYATEVETLRKKATTIRDREVNNPSPSVRDYCASLLDFISRYTPEVSFKETKGDMTNEEQPLDFRLRQDKLTNSLDVSLELIYQSYHDWCRNPNSSSNPYDALMREASRNPAIMEQLDNLEACSLEGITTYSPDTKSYPWTLQSEKDLNDRRSNSNLVDDVSNFDFNPFGILNIPKPQLSVTQDQWDSKTIIEKIILTQQIIKELTDQLQPVDAFSIPLLGEKKPKAIRKSNKKLKVLEQGLQLILDNHAKSFAWPDGYFAGLEMEIEREDLYPPQAIKAGVPS